MPSLLILLLTLGVSLRFSYNSSHGEASAAPLPTHPPKPPYHQHQPGNNVVIVVQNEPLPTDGKGKVLQLSPSPFPRPLIPEDSQRKEKRASRKNILLPAGIKRQGLVLAKSISSDDSPLLKKGKGIIPKFLQASPRHISSVPSDIFTKTFHPHKPSPPVGGGMSEKIMEFRPHQPDISPDIQTGKLPLPVQFSDDSLKHVSPTPMANMINPYTNGVASSFPPGIDPYEGFIRYAAENLETPMSNFVDYQSLEHYYGAQHPLNLPASGGRNHLKDASLDHHPYADSFSYGGGGGPGDVGNSPPLPSPPPPVGTARTNTVENFRARDNPEDIGPGGGDGDGDPHNSLGPYEHGIDHFHAPSPGMNSAAPGQTELSSYEDERGGQQSPEYGPPHRGPPFSHSSPFKGSPPPHANLPAHSLPNAPPPPDLSVFEEGPPPELSNSGPPPGPQQSDGPGGPPPPIHHHQSPSPHSSHPEIEQSAATDVGDDAIWGILDLAEMLEKGQIPGTEKDKGATSSSPGKNDRLTMPVYSGANPQKPFSPDENPASSYDYDDAGATEMNRPPGPSSTFGSPESQEATENDYEDHYQK